jgi:hypothetical protein
MLPEIALMSDDELLRAFEECAIPASNFHHREHLRMTWLYLRRDGLAAGGHNMADGIRRLSRSHGHADRYHETITRFWIHVVFLGMHEGPEASTSDDFVDQHPHILDKHLMGAHYSTAALHSHAARTDFVEPDLRRLPTLEG